MKIEVEFVRAVQEWDPATLKQCNKLVLAFGGTQFSVEVAETAMAQFISAAMTSSQGQMTQVGTSQGGYDPSMDEEDVYEGPSDASFLSGETDDDPPVEEVVYDAQGHAEDSIFGGDLVEDTPVEPPQTFQGGAVFDTESLPDADEGRKAAMELPGHVQRRNNIKSRSDQSPANQRKAEKLRRRAKMPPVLKVRSGEGGYPDPESVRSHAARLGKNPQHVPGPNASPLYDNGPELRSTAVPGAIDGEDDGFAQG